MYYRIKFRSKAKSNYWISNCKFELNLRAKMRYEMHLPGRYVDIILDSFSSLRFSLGLQDELLGRYPIRFCLRTELDIHSDSSIEVHRVLNVRGAMIWILCLRLRLCGRLHLGNPT